ncbi:MAG: hypothetical protein IIB53_08970 [Planctomycetes bacterium]|nr:hypothetical protein [Planctomycetota bacterium]
MIAATTSRLPRCFCAIALGMTIWATQALAQPQIMIRSSEGGSFQTVAPGRFSNLLRPDYTRRDLKIILSELQITRDQRYVLEVLLDDYTERFNKAVEQFKAVRDRYQGPAGRFGAFGSAGAQEMAEIALQSLQENLANVHTFELEGGGGTFVGILHSEISGGGGEGGVWFGGGGEDGDGSHEIKMHVAIVATVETDGDHAGDAEHTIPPEVLQRLHESLRKRLEERLRARRDELAKAMAEIAEREDRQDEEEAEEATADDVAAAARTLLAERTQLKHGFETDLTLLLSDEQAEVWPVVDRQLRRLNTLSRGELAGESLDLYQLVDQWKSGAAKEQPVADTLDDYELRLDDALSQRNAFLTESEVDTFMAWAEQDHKKSLALIGRESDLRRSVRNVNEAFAETIAGDLDEQEAASFRHAARKAAYQSVYRTMRQQRLFAQAKAIDGLDSDVLDAVTNLETAYLEELALVNDQLVEATHDYEPGQKKRMIEMMQQFRSGSMQLDRPPTNPIIDGHRQRRSLGERYAKQLKSILTTEQFESLPAAKPQLQTFTIQRSESN